VLDVVPLPLGELFDREAVRYSGLSALARGDGIAMRVEERVAQQASDTLVLTLGELMLLGVGDAVPVLGGIA